VEFRITAKDGKARAGELFTEHGMIETPNFIPVATKGTIKSLSQDILDKMEIQALLCNTYHLFLRPGEKLIARQGGLHKFMSWSKPLFTDSGGFQVFSLNDNLKIDDEKVIFRSCIDNSQHIFTPERAIQIQHDLGADIIFAFDECLHFDSDYETVQKSLQRTHAWAERCLAEHTILGGKQTLYGVVQGGQYEDLRRESAKFIADLGFLGFGLGSIFGKPKQKVYDIINWMMEELPEEKPKHLLGIGAVEDIFNGVELGVDTFDCVLPTRLARMAYVFTSEGNEITKWRYRVTNNKYREDLGPLDENCECSVCKRFTRSYIHNLFRNQELLAYSLVTEHNLSFFNQLMKTIREAIRVGKFKEIKEKWTG